MKYSILLFDIDDTLLDFSENENRSLKRLFNLYGINNFSDVVNEYKRVNESMWRQYEKGELRADELFNTRFAITMKYFGKEVNGIEWENKYRQYLSEEAFPIGNSSQIIKKLSEEGYRLFAVSNGIGSTQISRLNIAGMKEYFEDIFISGDIGAQKPSKIFFEYVGNHIKNFNKEYTLMIGNSLATDIVGGINSGLDTCWFNPLCNETSKTIKSTYIIEKLEDLFDII